MSTFDKTLSGRTKRAVLVSLAFVLPLGLGACAETVGAGAGAYAGNQFGHGSGKTAATVGGAVAGAAVGHAVDPGF